MIWRCFLFFTFLSSCQHFIKKSETFSSKVSHEDSSSSFFYAQLDQPYKSAYGEIPLDEHPDVKKWLKYFTGRGKSHMKTYLQRSSRYLPLMKAVLKENDLPLNLVYVALIESGFSPKAHSRANAVGYWQFIEGTGKRYGLRIDGFVDERRDPLLSTRAAAQYFKDLYSLFGSWHLALAAYNAGEYRVNRAVLRYYNRNFWKLSSKRAFPSETRNYIPKLIAAIHISQNPKKYGFSNLEFQDRFRYESLEIKKSISLKKLAINMNKNPEELKRLNPMYRGEYVPMYGSPVKIRIPHGETQTALAALDKSFMARPEYSYHYYAWYRVKRGDSLYKIARRHKTSVKKLRRANKLGRSSLIRVGQRLKIPSRKLLAKKVSSGRKLANSKGKEFHVVRKGESLTKVSRRYGIKLASLKKLNNIQGNPVIHPGQRLRIKQAPTAPKTLYHIVRKGETLIEIAKKYKISLPKLMKANSLNFKSILLTGTKLVIPQ